VSEYWFAHVHPPSRRGLRIVPVTALGWVFFFLSLAVMIGVPVTLAIVGLNPGGWPVAAALPVAAAFFFAGLSAFVLVMWRKTDHTTSLYVSPNKVRPDA